MKHPAWVKGAWHSLFAAQPRCTRRQATLQLTALEDRTTPATFAQNSATLDLNLSVYNTRLGIVSAGTSYTLTLTGDTWSGTDTANATGNGTATLLVTPAGLAAFTAVNLTNSDNGVQVTFNDSGANAYSDDFNVTLTGFPNPVSFAGATNFGAFNLTVDTAQAIRLDGAGTALTSSTGNITLKANAGASPTPGDFDGLSVSSNALIQVTGSGELTLQGRGGTAGHGDEIGVAVFSGGRVVGGTGAVSVIGTGGVSTGQANYGVYLDSAASEITSAGGDVTVTGTGGGFAPSASNLGVYVGGGAELSAGGSGTVTVTGSGGGTTTGNFNYGVQVTDAGSIITSAGGDVSVTGTGGGSGASTDNMGVLVEDGGQITAGGNGAVTVTGTGGMTTGNFDHGVLIFGSGTRITSGGGNVRVTGTGRGTGSARTSTGVAVDGGAELSAGGMGSVAVIGTGGPATTGSSYGVFILALITSSGGDISVTGTPGAGAAVGIMFDGGSVSTATNGGNVTLTADSMNLASGTVAAPAANSVTLRPLTAGLGIDIGGAGAGPELKLSDTLLDQMAALNLRIGGAGTGAITFSAVITRDGNVVLTGSTVTGSLAGTDLDVGTGTLSFGPGTTLASTITGTTPDTGYDRLSVAGGVNLSGVGVALSGPFAPPIGTVFELVEATAAVSGSFGPATTTLNGVLLELSETATSGVATAVPAPVVAPPAGLFAAATGGGGGQVNVYNADGSPRFALVPFAGYAGGVAVATGDVNNDGVADVVVGTAAGASHVKVFDGLSGAELYSFLAFDGYAGGVAVAAGDVNNDGYADVIVGTARGASHVKAFDLRAGAVVRSFLALPTASGVTVGSGDVNNDGFADLVVGAAAGSSLVRAFDGQTGGQILELQAFAVYAGGVSVAGGDLDGDGFAEVIVGANAGGHVKAFGAGGGERLSFLAYPGFGGAARVGSVDADGDQRAEILTGAGPGAGPHVKRFDGQSLATLDSFLAFGPGFTGGVYVG